MTSPTQNPELQSKRPTKLAIIGRPNVGKSSLFNYMAQSRKSVVKNQPGVTRDIIVEKADLWNRAYEVIDTGGLTEATDTISQLIREQVIEFLKSVDLLFIVMDGKSGVMPEDRDLVKIANEAGKPYLIVVNKLDSSQNLELNLAEFYEFGEDVLGVSVEQRLGLNELLEWLHPRLNEVDESHMEALKIAIVGKPNVGKSSIINKLLGEKRVLVSDIAGTTVDSVEVPFRLGDQQYILVDTAGLRRSARRTEDVEVISSFKSSEAIRRADLVLLLIDSVLGPTDQDSKIIQEVTEQHKGVLVVANKIDLAEEERPEARKWFRDKMAENFHFFPDLPLVFTSALTGKGLEKMFDAVEGLHEKLTVRIPTSQLNDFFVQVIRQAPAPLHGTKTVKFYYLTQTHQVPPSFIAFANHPDGVNASYRRFLSKRIKEKFDLEGVPIRIFVMKSRG